MAKLERSCMHMPLFSGRASDASTVMLLLLLQSAYKASTLTACPVQEKPAGESKPKAAAANGHDAEEWRTADPYAMFPKPADNRAVHTSIPFSDAPTLHVANTPEQLEAHLKVLNRPKRLSPTMHTAYLGAGAHQRSGPSCLRRIWCTASSSRMLMPQVIAVLRHKTGLLTDL